MFVFGGKSNGYHNDIWKFDLGNLHIFPFIFRISPKEQRGQQLGGDDSGERKSSASKKVWPLWSSLFLRDVHLWRI